MTEPLIDPERVREVAKDCLLGDDSTRTDCVVVDAVTAKFVFDPDKLRRHSREVEEMLSNLPEQFREEVGGGWSFLNACEDGGGVQWTGHHAVVESLFALGMGIGKVKCPVSRKMWGALPGGVPYFTILKEGLGVRPNAQVSDVMRLMEEARREA